MIDVDIRHHFGGGVYIKETRIPARHVMVQHKHKFEHLSVLASGIANVLRSSSAIERQYEGPSVLTIEADEHHRVEAITDCVWLCIHATEESDPAKIDEELIIPSGEDEMRQLANGKQR
jgi:hypothetical protein